MIQREIQPGYSLNIGYWNSLFEADPLKSAKYAAALISERNLDLLIIDECTAPLADAMGQLKGVRIDKPIEQTQHYKGYKLGVVVVGRGFQPRVTRTRPWSEVDYREHAMPLWDAREMVRTEVPLLGAERLAVYGAHITHPHYVLHPRLSLRRPREWEAYQEALKREKGEYLWLADTNTILSQTVRHRLGNGSTNARLLTHEGGPTWMLRGLPLPKLLYLDRGLASPGIANRTRLHTVDRTLGGVRNPSDHAAIVASIRKPDIIDVDII